MQIYCSSLVSEAYTPKTRAYTGEVLPSHLHCPCLDLRAYSHCKWCF